MPCFTQRTFTFELQAADKELLIATLTLDLGWQAREYENGAITGSTKNYSAFKIANGKLEIQGDDLANAENIKNQIASGYARRAVLAAASKRGFRTQVSAQNTNQIRLIRR